MAILSKYNKFSSEEKEILNLALDVARNEFSVDVDKRILEQNLRDKINNEMLGGLTLFQAIRRNKVTIFEVIETILSTTIDEKIFEVPFAQNFVEYKSANLGDKPVFYAEGNSLIVSTFAGNHWDTNRQKLNLGQEVTLPSEWAYVHVYDELERFLKNIVSLDKLLDKLNKSIADFMNKRIYKQFEKAIASIPSELTATGNDENAIADFCDKIAALNNSTDVTIAGTKAALRKLVSKIDGKTFANSQKEALSTDGSIGNWNGNKLMVIPQVLKSDKKTFVLDNTKLFVMAGENIKPIKVFNFGDVRTKETDQNVNNDMSIDYQTQFKIGVGMIVPENTGVFTIS